MKKFSISQAKRRLTRLAKLVATGEVVIITRCGKPVAQLVSLHHGEDHLGKLTHQSAEVDYQAKDVYWAGDKA
jgi:prevent-host-death family protein